MKYIKMIFVFAVVCVINIATNVQAANVSSEDYAKLRKVFSEGRIATMSDEEAAKYLTYDLDNARSEVKHYRVEESLNGSVCTEVSEEEINNVEKGIMPYSATHSTSYKSIYMAVTYIGGNKSMVELHTQWKVTPATKSFDVTGLRVDDATVVDGTQFGTQVYWTSQTQQYEHVNYSPNGTNIVKKSNGFGISMNLVDAASYFECDVQADVIANTKYAAVYGAYQHAVKDMTLAQSQSYNISHNGLGKVFNFSSSVEYYYDRMQGVDLTLDYVG